MKPLILLGGIPYSGKSTFGNKLESELGIPHYECDKIQHMYVTNQNLLYT